MKKREKKKKVPPIGLGSNAVKILVLLSLPVFPFVCLSPPSFLSRYNASLIFLFFTRASFPLSIVSDVPPNTDVNLVFHPHFMSHTRAVYIQ